MAKNHKAYIGLGSNLGSREENIAEALRRMDAAITITLTKISSTIETEPEGGVSQPKYLNAAAEVETTLSPRALLHELESIEKEMGREGKGKGLSRPIDLDILLYDDLVLDEPDLRIPHPLMHERDFVLRPLKEIAPDAFHPVIGKKVIEL